MKIKYEKKALKFLAWDPDYTKLTPSERQELEEAESGEFIDQNDIDWDNLEKYAE